ncbi:MAG: BolA family transcriptional regulator [Gluconacetobacter diazotrophicus]|nr:BolA family transcriptional regulator [Gluconacetobacter diazotrophicus]
MRSDQASPFPGDPRGARIAAILQARFAPEALAVDNDSARHAGHAGARAAGDQAGQTHYQVTLRSAAFAGLNRVQRSRTVHEALAPEFDTGLHALSLRLSAPGE